MIRNLTKADVVEFYNTFIDFSSPKRSKISVHMHAAATPPPPAPVPTSDQKATLALSLSQFISSQGGVSVDAVNLAKALESTDLTKAESIIGSVTTFLSKELKLSDEKVKVIIDQGSALLEPMLSKLSGSLPNEKFDGDQGQIIEDVYGFKAGLEMTKGARPVRPLVEFEESSVKL